MVHYVASAATLLALTSLAASVEADVRPEKIPQLNEPQRLRKLDAGGGSANFHFVTDVVTECEEVVEGNPPICINLCVEVTSKTKGGTLVEETSKVTQRKCKSTNAEMEEAAGSTARTNSWYGSAQNIAGDGSSKANKSGVASVGGEDSGKSSKFPGVKNAATSNNGWYGSAQIIAGDSVSKKKNKGGNIATSAEGRVGSSKSSKSQGVENVDASTSWNGSAQSIARNDSSKANKATLTSNGGVDSSKSSKLEGAGTSAQSIVGINSSKSNKNVVVSNGGGVGSSKSSKIVAVNGVLNNIANSNNGWSGSAPMMKLEAVDASNYYWANDGWDITKDGWNSSYGQDKNTIENVRTLITKLIKDSERELIPKFLRLGFHDCVGGCDGCIDMNNPDNKGLEEPMNAIFPIVEKYKDSLSRADIWAMATLVSADLALVEGRPEGLQFPMRYIGRKDCEGATVRGVGGPDNMLPSNHVTTHELLDFFSEKFNFDTEETVIIMGVHAVATVHRDISGFGVEGEEFGWVFDAEDYVLDNRYYKMLVGDDDPVTSAPLWQGELVHNEGDIPPRYQWFHKKEGEEERPIMTSADIGLVRDLAEYMHDENGVEGIVECVFKEESSGSSVRTSNSYTRQRSVQQAKPVCPVASETLEFMIEYKLDNEAWLIDFERVLEKMLTNGYKISG